MLKLLVLAGLLGSIVMYAGDLLLYYSPREYDLSTEERKMRAIYYIMENLPNKRLIKGGLCGGVASFFAVIGAWHITYIMQANLSYLGVVVSLVWMFAFIFGGIYHTHWAYIGLLGKISDNQESVAVVERYTHILQHICVLAYVIANLALSIIVVAGFTTLPRLFVLVTPLLLFVLLPLWRKLPQPYYLAIVGGYGNLPFIVYYFMLLFFV